MERRVRGSVLNAWLKYVKKKWGKAGLDKCLGDIGLSDCDAFKDGSYYYNEIHENIMRWLSREKGPESVREGGKFVVKNLGILAWLVRFTDPKSLAERFPKNYSEVYTFGRLGLNTSKDGIIVVKLYDVNQIEEGCMAWTGVCEGALELTKTRGSVEKSKCTLLGDDCCEYQISYETKG